MDDQAADVNDAFLRARNSLLWSVFRIVRDKQIAEELTQESYLRARKAASAGALVNAEAFLQQTARNLALDYLRQRKVRSNHEAREISGEAMDLVADDQPSAEEQVIHLDRLRAYQAALDKLPKRAQQVWVLSRVEGWSYPQIAEHLDVSPNTVFNDMKHAMAHLNEFRKRLDKE
jgi:RNA polymerase sigma factor (sigma-70 family)